MSWMDFWGALDSNGALPSVGVALLVIGAAFRWFEPLCHLLGRWAWRSAPFAATADHARRLRAAGDEGEARRVEERVQDHRRRLSRYGDVMMLSGLVILATNVWLR